MNPLSLLAPARKLLLAPPPPRLQGFVAGRPLLIPPPPAPPRVSPLPRSPLAFPSPPILPRRGDVQRDASSPVADPRPVAKPLLPNLIIFPRLEMTSVPEGGKGDGGRAGAHGRRPYGGGCVRAVFACPRPCYLCIAPSIMGSEGVRGKTGTRAPLIQRAFLFPIFLSVCVLLHIWTAATRGQRGAISSASLPGSARLAETADISHPRDKDAGMRQ